MGRDLPDLGLASPDPWSLGALRLLFSAPRVYQPLADAWERRVPGTKRALRRLLAAGLVEFQPGLVLDTVTGRPGTRPSRKVGRFRLTAAGRRLLDDVRGDPSAFKRRFPRTRARNLERMAVFLEELSTSADVGVSARALDQATGMGERLVRWWLRRLADQGLVVELGTRAPDVREVVPAHWRPTRRLARMARAELERAGKEHLKSQLGLGKSKFLSDITPSRLSAAGATDFLHDVEAQQVAASLLGSPRWEGGEFRVEPRAAIGVDKSKTPWPVVRAAGDVVIYQPDVEMRISERARDGRSRVRRVLVEYERFQARRDAWGHIEKMLAYLWLYCLEAEPAALCFVVSSDARHRVYVELVEAFCDYALSHPERMPANEVLLAVSTADRVESSADPFRWREWSRILLPASPVAAARQPVIHPTEGTTPYDMYFGA